MLSLGITASRSWISGKKAIREQISFKCSLGHEFLSSYRRIFDSKCPICSPYKSAVKTKHSLEQKLKDKGFTLVSPYNNSYSPVLVRCSFGHEFEIKRSVVKPCPNCLLNSKIEEYLKNNWVLLEPYKNSHWFHRVSCTICKSESLVRLVYAHTHKCKQCFDNKRDLEVKEKFVKIGLELLEDYKLGREGMRTPLKIKCLTASHEFEDTYESIVSGSGCPVCDAVSSNKSYKFSFKEKLKSAGWSYINGEYKDGSSQITASCPKGHISTKRFGFYFIDRNSKSNGCLVCQRENSIIWTDETIKQYFEDKPITLLNFGYFEKPRPTALLECEIDGYKWEVDWYSFISENRGCPKCAGNLKITREEGLVVFESQNYKVLDLPESFNCETNILVQCPNNHAVYYSTVHRFKAGQRCLKCFNAAGKSKAEIKIANFLEDRQFNVEIGYKFANYDIDVYLPDYKLGIEYNGAFYHSLLKSDYHQEKYKKALEFGIELIQIFEDDYNFNVDYWMNYILSRLGIPKDTDGTAILCRLDDGVLPAYTLSRFDPSIGNFKHTLMALLEKQQRPFIYRSDNLLSEDKTLIEAGGQKIDISEPDWCYVKSGIRYGEESGVKTDLKVYDAGKSIWLFKREEDQIKLFQQFCKLHNIDCLTTKFGFVEIKEQTIPLSWFSNDEIIDSRGIVESMLLSHLGRNKSVYSNKIERIHHNLYVPFLKNNSLDGKIGKVMLAFGSFFEDELVGCVVIRMKKDKAFCQFCTKIGFEVGISELLQPIPHRPLHLNFDKRFSCEKYEQAGFKFDGTYWVLN